MKPHCFKHKITVSKCYTCSKLRMVFANDKDWRKYKNECEVEAKERWDRRMKRAEVIS